MSDISKLVQDVVASPLGEVIASVGQGVADAQAALDEGSLAKTLEIYSEGGEEALKVLKDIGYLPTFYTLPETTGEVKVALKLGGSPNAGQTLRKISQPTAQPQVLTNLSRAGLNIPGIKPKMYATPVDAGYANRYSYQADVSATLTFKIVPVPPPAGVDDLRILPNVVGSTISAALLRLEELNLTAVVVDAEQTGIEEYPDDVLVTAQTPVINEDSANIVRAGDEVTLTLAVF